MIGISSLSQAVSLALLTLLVPVQTGLGSSSIFSPPPRLVRPSVRLGGPSSSTHPWAILLLPLHRPPLNRLQSGGYYSCCPSLTDLGCRLTKNCHYEVALTSRFSPLIFLVVSSPLQLGSQQAMCGSCLFGDLGYLGALHVVLASWIPLRWSFKVEFSICIYPLAPFFCKCWHGGWLRGSGDRIVRESTGSKYYPWAFPSTLCPPVHLVLC